MKVSELITKLREIERRRPGMDVLLENETDYNLAHSRAEIERVEDGGPGDEHCVIYLRPHRVGAPMD